MLKNAAPLLQLQHLSAKLTPSAYFISAGILVLLFIVVLV